LREKGDRRQQPDNGIVDAQIRCKGGQDDPVVNGAVVLESALDDKAP
jgi:hypothetical protein